MTITREEIKQAVMEAGSENERFGFPVKEDGLFLQQDPEEYSAFVHYVASDVNINAILPH